MGAEGCIGTQQTQNRVKRVIDGCAQHNCGQTCVCGGREMSDNEGREGDHMNITEHTGGVGEAKGDIGEKYSCPNNPDEKRIR